MTYDFATGVAVEDLPRRSGPWMEVDPEGLLVGKPAVPCAACAPLMHRLAGMEARQRRVIADLEQELAALRPADDDVEGVPA